MNAISPALSGTPAYNFKNLTPNAPLNMPTVGATGGLAQQQSQYNYNPQQVKSAYNYTPNQVSGAYGYNPSQVQSNYSYAPAQVKSTLDNSKFTQDYFDKGIKAPLLRTYDQSIAPRIEDAAASAGSTFSTRTQQTKQRALGDLQTQMAAQLTGAVRQDELQRAAENLQAQQFNVGTGVQNAQFGSGQNFQAQQLNQAAGLQNAQFGANFGQNAQQLNQAAGLQSAQFGAGQNLTAQQLNQSAGLQNAQFGAGQQTDYAKINAANAQFLNSLNSQNRLQQQSLNNQNKLSYDTLNTQTNVGLGENARANQMQAATQAMQFNQAPYQTALMGEQLLNPLQSYNNAAAQNAYTQWQNQQPYNSPYTQLALQIAGVNSQPYIQQNPTAMQQALQGIGIAGAGASLLGGLGGAGAGVGFGSAGTAALGEGVAGATLAGSGGLLGGVGSALGGAGSGLWGLLAALV